MRTKILIIAASMTIAGIAGAMQPANVEYSADSYIESSEGVMQGKLYSARGKERREYVQDGEKMAMVMRHDKKVVWMLMPEEKMYMEMKVPKEGRKDDISGWKVEQSTVGPETVNGVSTTKSKIIMTGPKGEKLGGFWWATKENIIVKIDAIAVDKKSKERFKTELKNLKIGKQDASLFEIPAGYSKMSMGGMMMGGMKDDGDKPAPKGSSENKAKGEGGGFGFKDALKMLKE